MSRLVFKEQKYQVTGKNKGEDEDTNENHRPDQGPEIKEEEKVAITDRGRIQEYHTDEIRQYEEGQKARTPINPLKQLIPHHLG